MRASYVDIARAQMEVVFLANIIFVSIGAHMGYYVIKSANRFPPLCVSNFYTSTAEYYPNKIPGIVYALVVLPTGNSSDLSI